MRQRIMDGAMAEMHERGIKFTMDDLARRLGVSKRTLYENFSSKEELVGSLLAEAIAELKAKREAIARDETLDIREKFRQMMTVRPALWNERTDNLMLDIKKSMPEQCKKLESTMDELWQVIEDLLHEGARTGYFRPVFFPVIRAMFKGAYNELSAYKLLREHRLTVTEMLNEMLDILMYGVVVTERDEERVRGKTQ